jgi:hypothetical protein
VVKGELRRRQPHEHTIFDSLFTGAASQTSSIHGGIALAKVFGYRPPLLRRLAEETSRYGEKLVLVRYPSIEHVDGREVYREYPFQKALRATQSTTSNLSRSCATVVILAHFILETRTQQARPIA